MNKTGSKLFLILVLFMEGQHLHRIHVLIGFGIHVGDVDIQNGIRSRRPDAMYKEVPWSSLGVKSGAYGAEAAGAKATEEHIVGKDHG